MKKILIHIFGKIKDPALQQLNAKYLNLLSHYSKVEIKIHRDNAEKKISSNELREIDGQIILLSESGNQLSTNEMRKLINTQLELNQQINLVIGNAFGFEAELLAKTKSKIALSKLTFTHEMTLTILLEQLYRIFTLNTGGKYHK